MDIYERIIDANANMCASVCASVCVCAGGWKVCGIFFMTPAKG